MYLKDMKYLKLFEDLETINSKDMKSWGSKDEPIKTDPKIDKKYFDLVFADFLDQGALTECGDESTWYRLYNLFVNFRPNNFDEFKNHNKFMSELCDELKSCVDKLKDEYPNILHALYFDYDRDHISLALFYPMDYFKYSN